MVFPRQEYWNGLSLPSPGNLPNPDSGIKPASPALQMDSLPLSQQASLPKDNTLFYLDVLESKTAAHLALTITVLVLRTIKVL